jgi:outer membrane protein assembly factor BamA
MYVMRLLLIKLFFLFVPYCYGQGSYKLQFSGENLSKVVKKVPDHFNDSLSVLKFLRDLQLKAISKGYLLCSIDSLNYSDKKFTASIHLGDRLEAIYLSINDGQQELAQTRYRERAQSRSDFTPAEVAGLLRKQLESSANKGYPFAKVCLKNVSYSNDKCFATIDLNEGPLFRWKEIHIKGDSAIAQKTVSALLRIKNGDLYREDDVRSISDRIRQLNYLQEMKAAEILFTPEGAELFLFLKSVPVSAVNGIVGLQPNPVTERVSVTGDVNLKLLNTLKRGELIQLNWRSIQSGVQSLNMQLNYPFLFKTAFGLDGGFQLYKRDSTFLETRSRAGVQYMLDGGSLIKVYYTNHQSSLLSTQNISSSLRSFKTNSYGLSFTRRTVDYLPNPRKGFQLFLEIGAGTRLVEATSDTSTNTRSTTFNAGFQVQYFIPIYKRHVLKLSALSETYHAPEIYRNELFRFGGLNTLRGFNEEEFFASTRALMSIEYRFLTDKNSHAFVFYDQAIYEDVSEKYKRDTPFGFGAGFSFGTNLGIFSISYALGKQQNNPVELRNGKVHFGYIAYF